MVPILVLGSELHKVVYSFRITMVETIMNLSGDRERLLG